MIKEPPQYTYVNTSFAQYYPGTRKETNMKTVFYAV